MKKKDRMSSGVIGVTFGIIGLAFVVVLVAIWNTEPCPKALPGAWLWPRHIGCLKANELGDLLAGVFAPLAFLGLAAALYVQSKELYEARKAGQEQAEAAKEQAEAAKEQAEAGREQAAAAHAQAEEVRRSSAYYEEQTEALRRQRREADQDTAFHTFQARFEEVVVQLNRPGRPGGFRFVVAAGNDFVDQFVLDPSQLRLDYRSHTELDSQLDHLLELIKAGEPYTKRVVNPQAYLDACKIMVRTQQISVGLSATKVIETGFALRGSAILKMQKAAQVMITLCDDHHARALMEEANELTLRHIRTNHDPS